MSQHIVPIRIYLLIFVTLLALTALTVEAAFVDLGLMNVVVAMTIAVFKALLVVLYFMHVRYSSHLTKLFVSAGVVWLAILLALTASDYISRDWIPRPEGWETAGASTPQPVEPVSSPGQ